ncbi:hypothetical protein [Streptomyces sp. T21Q-yed]|uniref:hypothetical protein n=1 Tax=Streptomyces sp. T21Q-yed TaxID=3018441 RepID=UPI0023DECD07|nr:hypothetical protein [Streptomyces sp. T21Q-yed]MDF3146082.1 hypothetical protein [Streptomyces sp. T21Q-yed]
MLLVSPESTETAALYYADEEYGELERLLGTAGKGTRDKPPEAGLTVARQINITWMIHDVTPWRLDRVYPVHKGQDVWIHTAANLDSTTNGTWHRADHPSQLRALLKKLGLMGKVSDEGRAAIFPPGWEEGGTDDAAKDSSGLPADAADKATEASPAQGAGSGPSDGTGDAAKDSSGLPADAADKATEASPAQGAGSGPSDGTGWWWALPGAAAGAVLALVLRPFAARLPLDRLRGEPEPRQELRDV